MMANDVNIPWYLPEDHPARKGAVASADDLLRLAGDKIKEVATEMVSMISSSVNRERAETTAKLTALEADHADVTARLSAAQAEHVQTKDRLVAMEAEHADAKTKLAGVMKELAVTKAQLEGAVRLMPAVSAPTEGVTIPVARGETPASVIERAAEATGEPVPKAAMPRFNVARLPDGRWEVSTAAGVALKSFATEAEATTECARLNALPFPASAPAVVPPGAKLDPGPVLDMTT